MWSILRSAYPALSYVLNTEVVHNFSVYVYFFQWEQNLLSFILSFKSINKKHILINLLVDYVCLSNIWWAYKVKAELKLQSWITNWENKTILFHEYIAFNGANMKSRSEN